MNEETYLRAAEEREIQYFERQPVGSDEYAESLARIMDIEKQLSEYEKNEDNFESNRHERELSDCERLEAAEKQKQTNRLEWTKTAFDVILPLVGMVVIVGEQKDISFIGALKDVMKCFIPRRR